RLPRPPRAWPRAGCELPAAHRLRAGVRQRAARTDRVPAAGDSPGQGRRPPGARGARDAESHDPRPLPHRRAAERRDARDRLLRPGAAVSERGTWRARHAAHPQRRRLARHPLQDAGSRPTRPDLRGAMTFGHPLLLLTLLVVPAAVAAYWFNERRRARYAVRFTNVAVLEQVLVHTRPWRRWLTNAAFLLAIAVLCV